MEPASGLGFVFKNRPGAAPKRPAGGMEPQQTEPHLRAPCAHLEVSAAPRPAAASAVALPLVVFTLKKALMLTKTEQSAAAVEQCPALPKGWGQQRAVEPQHRFPSGPCSCCRMGLTGRLVSTRNAWGWARRGRGEREEIPWGRSTGGGAAWPRRCWMWGALGLGAPGEVLAAPSWPQRWCGFPPAVKTWRCAARKLRSCGAMRRGHPRRAAFGGFGGGCGVRGTPA